MRNVETFWNSTFYVLRSRVDPRHEAGAVEAAEQPPAEAAPDVLDRVVLSRHVDAQREPLPEGREQAPKNRCILRRRAEDFLDRRRLVAADGEHPQAVSVVEL